MKYKIKRKRRAVKTWHILVAFLIILIFISISYAQYSTILRIIGSATGEQEQLDVFYQYIDNSSSYPSSVGYMGTFTYTFANPPTIVSITMGGNTLTLNTDYTYSNGTLTIPNVTGALLISGEETEVEDFTIKYIYGDNLEFDGKSLLNTGIPLFTTDNIRRDFDVTVNIDNQTYNAGQAGNFNSLINEVDHNNTPYHGFSVRRDQNNYYSKITKIVEGNNEVVQTTYNLNDMQNVLISRRSDILYADYTNGSNLTQVGDFSNYNTTFNFNLYIGADSDKSNPIFRGFKGQLSNVTVKLYYEEEEAPVTLPTPIRTGYTFDGWYSNSSFTNKVGDGGASFTPTSENTNLYAKWFKSIMVAELNGTKYETLQGAINAVPKNNVETTITLLEDTSEVLTVSSGKNIVFDLQNKTISNNGVAPVIANSGRIKIINGTITSKTSQGAINNNSGGTLIMTGGSIIAKGTRQAIYNNGGTAEISGTAYLSSVSTERATVQNLNSGILTITGGTIVSSGHQAIENVATLTIGTKDGSINATSPVLQGVTYGVRSSGTFNFYDGITKGITGAISGTINDKETNSQVVTGSETISGSAYETKYLEVE